MEDAAYGHLRAPVKVNHSGQAQALCTPACGDVFAFIPGVADCSLVVMSAQCHPQHGQIGAIPARPATALRTNNQPGRHY